MKTIFTILLFIFISQISNADENKYEQERKYALKKQKEFQSAYLKAQNSKKKDSIVVAATAYLDTMLLNHIYPYWYGTGWNYNGTTEIPKVGETACGYFVSTTLKHIGFQIESIRCK
jgi:hypothetical protein